MCMCHACVQETLWRYSQDRSSSQDVHTVGADDDADVYEGAEVLDGS